MEQTKQQTAVEWLEQAYLKWSHEGSFIPTHLIEQARQMEEEQHHNTWLDSRIENSDGYGYLGKEKTFEQYYNETYSTN